MKEKKILVVDDEVQVRDSFKLVFDQAGYKTFLADSGEDALEVLDKNNIQVMYLDLNLSGMNGLELCRRIRKKQPMAIIYAVTGYTSLFELHDCREAGFDDYFTKPIGSPILTATAKDAFEKLERWKKKS